jgi:hypothetical protein
VNERLGRCGGLDLTRKWAKKTAPKNISAWEPPVLLQDLLQDLERVAENSPERWPVATVPLIESPSTVPLNSWVISPFGP